MKDHVNQIDENKGLKDTLIHLQKQEVLAAEPCITETLSKLNITIENLPQKCRETLQHLAETPYNLDYTDPTTISISLLSEKTNKNLERFTEEYEVLKLRQKNEELQAKIDRNNKFLENLKKELECSREALKKRNPNPDNVQDFIRQLNLKVATYEQSFEKAKTKYSKLQVPEDIAPKHLYTLTATLAQLKQEEADLQARAEDIKLARNARKTLHMLRR